MKKIFIIIMFIFAYTITNAQQELYEGEISFRVLNNISYSNVTIQMELINSLCWNANGDPGYEDVHDLTTLFGGGSVSLPDPIQQEGLIEFLGCWETTSSQYYRTFGLGLYKFTAKVNGVTKDQTTIDYRTSSLQERFRCPGDCDPEDEGESLTGDLRIDFDVSTGKFYYPNTQNEFPTNTTFWALKFWVFDNKSNLEPLPPENFQLTSSGGHPYLSWNQSTNTQDYWTGYAIYRSVVTGCNSPAGSFTKIATVSKYTNSYTDYDFSVGGPMTAYYKVASVNYQRESEFTTTKNICVGLNKESIIEESYDFSLEQNYPNPFNPLTNIEFSIKDNSFVSLRIFDLLGREVEVLVDEVLNAGNHKIQFNGSKLESGIYFYEIFTGDFRDVKKLILIK
ncbi:MAG: T9SS type A sorting domain-containing protein [Ignavibacteriaceae bacterium]